MDLILEAHGLRKHYGEVHALDGVDLQMQSGRVLAVLGPNGAGKTTFIRSVATLTKPDEGTLLVGGVDVLRDPLKVRRMIGLAGQYAAVEPTMTGRENLEIVAQLFGLSGRVAKSNSAAVLEQIGLTTDEADRRVGTYSGGMRRKLDLGASLVGAPKLLLLDEPTTGLDPRSRTELWDAIRELVATGTDVVLTTQYLEEADQLAHDIVIFDHGKVIASGTPLELKSTSGHDVIEIHADPQRVDEIARLLKALSDEEPRIEAEIGKVAIPVASGTSQLREAIRVLDDAGIEVEEVGLRRPTLDEVFLSLTGGSSDDSDEPAPTDDRDALEETTR
jgi:ABC-2 type transport system ATP-binding protein